MSDISKIKLPDGSEFNIKDAAVPSWAKAASKPSYTAEEVGAATISYVDNALALKASASDLSALSNTVATKLTTPSGTNGQFLSLVDGVWTAVDLPTYEGGVN